MKVFSFISKISSTEFAVYDSQPQILQEVLKRPPGIESYECASQILNETIRHSYRELSSLMSPAEQGQFRFREVMEYLSEKAVLLKNVQAVITQVSSRRLRPGIYLVNGDLLDLLKEKILDENTIRAGAFMAWHFAEHINREYDAECLSLVVQPAIENEIRPIAALSGIRGVTRSPVFHSFSLRGAASLYAANMGKEPNEINIVTAHLGTEISVGAFRMGRIIDCNSPFDGEGPFSPTTSGTLPADGLLQLCYSRKYDMDEMMRLVNQEGGLMAYLGTARMDDVREAFYAGDGKTCFMVTAMAYQVAREIGARATALYGNVEGIVLTGPWASFVEEIRSRVEWIAPLSIHMWESELFMLAIAAVDVYYHASDQRILIYGHDRS